MRGGRRGEGGEGIGGEGREGKEGGERSWGDVPVGGLRMPWDVG